MLNVCSFLCNSKICNDVFKISSKTGLYVANKSWSISELKQRGDVVNCSVSSVFPFLNVYGD